MSENYNYCYGCGQAIRIGLDDENDEYAWCGECDMDGEKIKSKEKKNIQGVKK